MLRLPSVHAAPAVVAVVASLVAPLAFGAASGPVSGSGHSAVARAAVADPVPAPQVRFAIGGLQLEQARGIAEQQWGGAVCGGKVEIVWTPLEEGTNATASWRNPTDAWNNPGENFDCRIDLNADSDFDWPKLCTVMAHEIGHLAGQAHAAGPGQLMSPVYSAPLPACDGPEPGAPAADPVEETDVVAVAADEQEPVRTRTTTRRLAGRSKRCTRRFSASRRTKKCGRVARRSARR